MNPYPQHDWRQMGGQPPYQGGPYRSFEEDEAAEPEPANGDGPPPELRNRHLVRNILGGVGILAIAGLVLSALSSNGTGASTPASRTSASPASSAATQATAPTATFAAAQATGPGKIGSYFDVQDGSGNTYQVTLVKVLDPVQGADQFNVPDPGNRFVGVVFRITALSGSPQGEDANNDATVIGSNGQVYTADFDRIAGYGNFEVGMIHAAQGDTVVGAVTFQLPQFVTVMEVLWTADGGSGAAVQWNIGT
jgi:hypothetical protein